MKKEYFILTLFLLIHITLRGQTKEYYSLVKDNIALMNTATHLRDYQTVVNSFQRISYLLPDEWLPYYYSSYCYIQISFLIENKNERDRYVEEARKYLEISDSISPDNSEIYVLKGFILQAYMNIEKMSRGIKYNKECLDMFEKAASLDPQNPRSYLWHAVQLLNTPSFMGGGKEKALPYFELALEHFKNFEPESDISPDWGHNYAKKKYHELYKEL